MDIYLVYDVMDHKRIPLKSADEYDAFSKWRNVHRWGRGQLKKIKRGYHKRFRKLNKNRLVP